MKNKIQQKIIIFTVLFIFLFSTCALAAARTLEFSDIDVALQLPQELHGATRSITSADPMLDILGTTAEELKFSFSTNHIYLEAFPDDLSYEIVLTGQDAPNGVKDFNALSEQEILATEYANNAEAVYTVDTINNNRYLVTKLTFEGGSTTAYTQRYTTIINGKTIVLALQSNRELTAEMKDIYQKILQSMEFREIKASLMENPFFTELAGTLYGLVITIGILGIILFCFIRLDKKSRASKS